MCKNTLFGGTRTTISGAKVQQKMHIRKYCGKKMMFSLPNAEKWSDKQQPFQDIN